MTMTSSSADAPVIVFAAGGTGGHLFPAIRVAENLSKKGFKPVFMIDSRAQEKFQEQQTGWEFYIIPSGGIVGKNTLSRLKAALRLFLGTLKAAFLLFRLKPRAVVGFGGYPSLPPLIAAKFFRKTRCITHEGNQIAGTANRLLARLGTEVCLSFAQTKGFPENIKTTLTGMPIRAEIENISTAAPYMPPQKNDPIYLLITGGSLGASALSELVPKSLALLPESLKKKLFIIQQADNSYKAGLEEFYSKHGIHVLEIAPFFQDMVHKLAKAHLIIGRAGGATVAEIKAAARPAILIPLPSAAADEQSENAKSLSNAQAGWLLPQQELAQNQKKLTDLLEKVFTHPDILLKTSENLSRLSTPEAAVKFADFISGEMSSSKNNL